MYQIRSFMFSNLMRTRCYLTIELRNAIKYIIGRKTAPHHQHSCSDTPAQAHLHTVPRCDTSGRRRNKHLHRSHIERLRVFR